MKRDSSYQVKELFIVRGWVYVLLTESWELDGNKNFKFAQYLLVLFFRLEFLTIV